MVRGIPISAGSCLTSAIRCLINLSYAIKYKIPQRQAEMRFPDDFITGFPPQPGRFRNVLERVCGIGSGARRRFIS
jgi:hypothetical protein